MSSANHPFLLGPYGSALLANGCFHPGIPRRLPHYTTHRHISRLPNELLSEIMLIVCELSGNSLDARLYLTWVCSHWRDVAIGDPQLWRTIRNTPYGPSNLDYIQACFSRSKMLDLDIEIDWPVDYKEIFDLSMPQISRIRRLVYTPPDDTLTLNMIRDNVESVCREWPWRLEAPCLSSLTLKSVVLAKNTFCGIYPKLKYLKLVTCGLHWDFPLSVSTLTTLHIVCPARLVSVDMLVENVAKMPALTELYLRSCLKNAPVVTRKYSLPSLRSLYLDEKRDQAWAFFQMIDSPGLLSLRGCLQLEGPFGVPESSTTLDFFKELHPSVWTDIRHLILRPLSIEAGNSPSISEPRDIMRFFILHHEFNAPSVHLQLDGVPIHNLEALSIGGGLKRLPDFIYSLPSLRCVKYLRLGTVEQDMISGLLTRVEMGEVSLPLLEEIHCQCESASQAEILRGALEQRKEILQRRLPKLTFEAFEESSEYLKMFEELVDVTECDEVNSSVEYAEDVDCEAGWR